MHFEKTRVALIGCGMISKVYLTNLLTYDAVELVGCSDIIEERAKARAEQFGIRQMTNEEIFADPSIEFVVNTTYPLSHYEVARAALEAGQSVYTEKMVCETVEQMDELIALAREKGLFFGGAHHHAGVPRQLRLPLQHAAGQRGAQLGGGHHGGVSGFTGRFGLSHCLWLAGL